MKTLEDSSRSRALRVAIVLQSPAPYRITLLNRLAKLPNIQLKVLLTDMDWRFLSRAVEPRDISFSFQLVPDLTSHFARVRATAFLSDWSPGLWSCLTRGGNDAVIAFGWTRPNTWLALLHGKLHRTRTLLWETSTPHPPGPLKRMLMPLIRSFFRAFDGYFVASRDCGEYLVSLGADARRIFLLPQIIDNDYYARAASQAREQRQELKRQLDICTTQVVLSVGRFIERKGVKLLLEAFKRVAESNTDVSLMYVGDGPEKQALVTLASEYGLAERVLFHDYVPSGQLPTFYAVADVFVLYSSYEPFGVVINEAMTASLPIITTPQVGAVKHLVEPGVNGLLVNYGDVDQLANALQTLLSDPARCAAMGRESFRIIMGWDAELAAHDFIKGMQSVMAQAQ